MAGKELIAVIRKLTEIVSEIVDQSVQLQWQTESRDLTENRFDDESRYARGRLFSFQGDLSPVDADDSSTNVLGYSNHCMRHAIRMQKRHGSELPVHAERLVTQAYRVV